MRMALRAARARPVAWHALGVATGFLLIGVVSGLVYALRGHMPVTSLGALYLLAVLPVAIVWGRAHALVTAAASMLVFNFLHLPPRLELTLRGEENWLTLAVLLVAALIAADLAASARRRAAEAEQREREAALLADVSTLLLSGSSVETELPRIAVDVAAVMQASSARIVLGPPVALEPGEELLGLRTGERAVGAVYVHRGSLFDDDAARRFLPALASLLAVAIDREQLAREALEAESLRRSDSIKTAILRSVSHDLRSPITAMRVAAESLGSRELALAPADREALIGTLRTELDRLDRVVGNLLELSRLEAGNAVPEPELRSVDGILVQALAGLDGHERVVLSVPDDLPLVRVDAAQIERVLVNLLDNALGFSPAGSEVRVRATARGDAVLVAVEDDGPGVSADEGERIFEPFRRGSAAVAGKGSGLGLAIARGFAEANGGSVHVERGSGGGAIFVLMLPAVSAAVPTTA